MKLSPLVIPITVIFLLLAVPLAFDAPSPGQAKGQIAEGVSDPQGYDGPAALSLPARLPYAPALGIILAAALYHAVLFILWRKLKACLVLSILNLLYFFSLAISIASGFPFSRFDDHLLYTIPILANIFLIMAQGLILARRHTDALAKERGFIVKTAAMEQSAKMRSSIIDTLSHEVRTPLTVMSAYAQLAAEQINEGKADGRTLSNLKSISREAKRLADFAVNTLRLSRLSDQPESEDAAPVQIGALAEQVAHLFQPLVSKAGRRLALTIPDHAPAVQGSADSLTRLLWNLLDNALTHASQGDIEIIVEAEGDKVYLTVKDYGAGVPSGLLPVIFERGVTASPGGGTGLGLSLCRDIALELGGTISLDSNPGSGTSVKVTLPAYGKEAIR